MTPRTGIPTATYFVRRLREAVDTIWPAVERSLRTQMSRDPQFKKQLASRISNGTLDELYKAARNAGAIGGKITGAGGGGFLLLYCPQHRQDDVRAALHGLPELPLRLERDGTKVIFNCRR